MENHMDLQISGVTVLHFRCPSEKPMFAVQQLVQDENNGVRNKKVLWLIFFTFFFILEYLEIKEPR